MGVGCQNLTVYQKRVASFAPAPKERLIARLKDAGVVVMPSIASQRHADRVAAMGADVVLVQGSEDGGHSGDVARTRISGTPWAAVVREGVTMKGADGLTWAEVLMAANCRCCRAPRWSRATPAWG